MKLSFISIFCFFITAQIFGQEKADTSEAIVFVRFDYGYHLTAGDFEERFENSNSIGGSFGYKTASNWVFTISGGSNFSRKVKINNLLGDIINSAGDVTDEDGELVKLIYEQRGLNFYASAGKIFNVFNSNPNSGLITEFGIGYLQHRIKIDYRDGTVYQLSDNMVKGYDRLHTGIAFRQFIGYQHFGSKNLFNFYLGVEFQEGITKNRREYNYDTKSFDKAIKNDFLYGLRVGWIIPIKKRSSEEFYYY